MDTNGTRMMGYRWRSSKAFVIACVAIALFSENFLYSYIIPILQVMLEDRLHVDKSQTQAATSLVLSVHAFVSMITGPLVGYLADRAPSRKQSLLMSLGAEMVGTIIIMLAPSVPILLVGRAIQGIGGNAAWIVGLATLTECVGPEDTGKTLGALSSVFTSGLLVGPMASGFLLELVGYWATWIVAIAVLCIDMGMRIVMVESKQDRGPNEAKYDTTGNVGNDVEARPAATSVQANEQTPLLATPTLQSNDQSRSVLQSDSAIISFPKTKPSPDNFYRFLLTNPRALTALTCHCAMAIILLSLDTTLPLHASRKFGWDTAQVSLMFLVLQTPSLLFATFLGMLKDRVGTKIPTSCGFLAMAVCVWLLGLSSRLGVSLAGFRLSEQVVCIVALAGIGSARTLISGSGIMEITNVMKQVQEQQPHRFGPNGKMSSAYSMTNLTWNTGKLIGPVISGYLVRGVGYYYMNVVIASISLVVSILALLFLQRKG